jgi:hypothetical protein
LPAPIRCIGSGHIRHEPLRCAPAALVAGRFCFIGVMHVPGWFGGFTYAASPASTPRRPDRECRRSARVLDRCRAEWRAAHPADAAGTGHGVGGGDDCLHQPLRLGFQRPDYRGDLASFGRVAASRPISGFQCARLSKQADKEAGHASAARENYAPGKCRLWGSTGRLGCVRPMRRPGHPHGELRLHIAERLKELRSLEMRASKVSPL